MPALPRWLSPLLFAAALAAAFWRIPEVAPPRVEPPAFSAAPGPQPIFAAGMLPAVGAFAGAPSLAQLADGRIAAAWVSGSGETATDLAIYFSLLERDGWSEPRLIANRESAAGGLFAHIRRVGQPQLFVEGTWLHLWYAAIGIGGGANVALAHSVSTDGGRHWSPPRRLPSSPLGGYGGAPAGAPLPLADGGLALPLRQELFSGHAEWLRLSATGRILDKTRLTHSRRAPPALALSLDAARALPDPGPAHPDTPLAALRLPNGRLLLAGNPASGRATLMLWLSTDEGQTWRAAKTLENVADGAADFSAPALLLGRDGQIHLAYAWRGRGIRSLGFNEAWLAQEP